MDSAPGPVDPTEAYRDLVGALRRYGRGGDQAGLRRILGAVQSMQAGLAALTTQSVTGQDPSGFVEATTEIGGRLTALRISPHAINALDAAALSRACLDAVQASRLAAVETFGNGTATVTGLAADAGLDEMIPPEMQSWQGFAELMAKLKTAPR